MPDDDWLGAEIGLVERQCRQLEPRLSDFRELLARARDLRVRGATVEQILAYIDAPGATSARRSLDTSLRAYTRAVARLRGEIVRHLVDHQGVSLTEVGTLLGVSRQVASTLYRSRSSGPSR